MRILFASLLLVGSLLGCSAQSRLVVSNNFSFADYHFVVMPKPATDSTHASLYGLDVELSNRLARYGLSTVGEKTYAQQAPEEQKRVLLLRMNVSTAKGMIVFSVSFDDAVTGRTMCSITTSDEGDLLDVGDRQDAFRSLSDEVIEALAKDKGLEITDD